MLGRTTYKRSKSYAIMFTDAAMSATYPPTVSAMRRFER